MVPAAAVSALLGRKAGKIADTRGNAFLFRMASVSLMAAFVLLSVLAGVSPVWISLLLIVGNAGQMFMQIALTNTISRTLLKEQTGVGMGHLSMLGFISGAVSSAIYSKIADHGAGLKWNVLNLFADSAAVYSNLYLVLSLMHVGILVFYGRQFSTDAWIQKMPVVFNRKEGKS